MKENACILCGSRRRKVRFQLPDLFLERLSFMTTLVECLECGLIYQDPQHSQAALETSYPDEYLPFQGRRQQGRLQHWLNDFGIQSRVSVVTRHRMSGRLLDVGCASGIFLHAMQKYPDWELFGVEPISEIAKTASEGLKGSIFAGTLNQAKYPDDFFDAITLWDVLEHLPDPNSTVEEIYRILKPGGFIALRLPNYDSWEAKLFGRFWVGLDAPRHTFVFRKKNISRLLEENGFAMPQIKTGIGSYATFVLSIQFWLTALHVRPKLRKRMISLLEFLPIRALLTPGFSLVDLCGYGPSMVVTAFKKSMG